MNTIERLAELAKGVPVLTVEPDGSPVHQQVFDLSDESGLRKGTVWGRALAKFIAACNPAAIAQAEAEYKAVVTERDSAEYDLHVLSEQHAALEAENAELREQLRMAEARGDALSEIVYGKKTECVDGGGA